MIDNHINHSRKPVCLSRRMAVHIRCLTVVALIALGLLADASPATVSASGAALTAQMPGQPHSSSAGQSEAVPFDNRIDRVQAQREQGNQSGITSPAPGSSVRGAVPILGTGTRADFVRYELYYKQEPSGDEAYIWIASETRQVQNGQLGVWQTGDLPPGIYTLRLRVVRPDGNYGEFFAPNISVNQEVPTPTPDGPTATPIPIDTPTPFPQPTVAPVNVEQPNLEEQTAQPTSTTSPIAQGNDGGANGGQAAVEPESGSSDPPSDGPTTGIIGNLGGTLSLDRLQARFFTGVRWSAGLFLLLGAVFAAKRLLEWVITKAE